MNLGDEAGLCKRGVEDMIHIDRKKLQEALFAGSGHGVCSVIGIRPCVRAIGEAAVRKMIYNALVWVFLRTHEHEAWVTVRICVAVMRAEHTVLGCADNRYH